MAFYGERFRRPDEEDIWEELKQMLLNPPSEQEIALKKQQEQAWIDSILNKAFPENPNQQTEQALKTNNSSMSPISTLNQKSLEGFGQNSINGFTNKKKQSEFPDLGKATDYKNESFAPVYDEEEKEMRKNYFRDPNHNIVIDEIEGPFIEKKKKPKYEAEEPLDYEEMPDEEEDTTSEELETSEETEEGNSKEEPEETSSELQDEPYLKYEDLLPDETDEEREEREARELEAFNKAWDKANGVEEKDADGVPTGGAADISEKMDKFYNILTNKEVDYSAPMTIKDKLTDFAVQNPITRSLYPASSDIYTDGMTKFSRATKNPDAQILENYLELDPVSQSQLRKYGVTPKHKGVYYDENSNISKLISDSPEIRDFIIKNKDAIQRGEITEYPFEFKTSRKDMLKNKESFDRGNSIQHGKMWDIKINDDNSYSAHVGDLVDYAQRNVKSLGDFMNNHGYNMQEKGNFENYFTLIKLKSWLDDEELRKRRKRRF